MDLITAIQEREKAFRVTVRDHSFVTDMHPEDGGSDAGPNPSELFAASVAACIGMVAAQYCRHHGYPETGIEVRAVVQLADHPKRIRSIAIDLEMPEGFPEDRKKAISNASRTCVISNTLDDPPEIDLEVI